MDLRRDFQLLPEDVTALTEYGYPWEAVKDGSLWVLLHEFPVLPGYNVDRTTAALQLPTGYPDAPIDMVYFRPFLTRADGKPIKATNHKQTIAGQDYQRWSRHRTRANPWKPGEDGLATHLILVEDWLAREFERYP